MNSQNFNDLYKSIECLVCTKVTANIVISNCEHIFCENCVNTLLKRRIVRCPKCKYNLSRRMFHTNTRISNLISLLNGFQAEIKDNDEQHITEKIFEKPGEFNLIVNQTEIEKYVKDNIENCQVILDEDKLSIVRSSGINVENNKNDIDDFISISQKLSTSQKPTTKNANISPIKLPNSKIKTLDKVNLWLNSHISELNDQSTSANEISESAFEGKKYYSVTKTNNKISSNKCVTKPLKIKSDCKDKDALSKIELECAVQLTDCLGNKENDISNVCKDKGKQILSDCNSSNKENSNSKDNDRIVNKLSCDLFSCDDIDSTKNNKQFKPNYTIRERKTFSLEANTEDLQNIEGNCAGNTQDALTLIFNQRLTNVNAGKPSSNETIVKKNCKYIKSQIFPVRRIKYFQPLQQPILFLLKGKLDVPKCIYRDMGVQYSADLQEKIIDKCEKQMVHVQTQTELEQTQKISDHELDDTDDINHKSPEITVIRNSVIKINEEQKSHKIDITQDTDLNIIKKTCKSSKRKRKLSKSSFSQGSLKCFRNVSFSSDSDIESCLKPVKSVQLPDMSDEDIALQEDMTVKFTSIQDSENSDTNIIKKRKVHCLTPSSKSSSLKENEVENVLINEEDSEPLNYDEILSTVFANIDAELNPSPKKQFGTVNHISNKKNIIKTVNKDANLYKDRSPMKQLISEVFSKSTKLCASTPINQNRKTYPNCNTDDKIWETSINTLDKTSNIDKIVGAIEGKYMEKELDRHNQIDILTSDLEQEINQNDSGNIIETSFSVPRESSHNVRQCSSVRKLFHNTDSKNKSSQAKGKMSKDILNETFSSTIVDYPKENTESYTMTLNTSNVEAHDMEISSSLEQKKNDKSQELIRNTINNFTDNIEKSSHNIGDSEVDCVPSSMEVKPLCIACSCLTQEDVILVKKFVHKFNLKFVMQYEDCVTHLIVRVNKENCAERSLKFINAMVFGVWVLNMHWINDCLSMKTLLPEFKYEVLDISLEPGPKRNRLALTKSLLINIKVFVIGPFHSTDIKDFKMLLRKSGAIIQNSHITAQLIVLDEGEHTKEEIEGIYKNCLKPLVDMTWFLDCICRGRLMKINDHILLPDLSEINLKSYPSQLFQDTERL